jgi:hypothetical protein
LDLGLCGEAEIGDEGEQLGLCLCSRFGDCFDWMARIRVSISVLNTEGLVSSKLSIELEDSGGDAKAVLS